MMYETSTKRAKWRAVTSKYNKCIHILNITHFLHGLLVMNTALSTQLTMLFPSSTSGSGRVDSYLRTCEVPIRRCQSAPSAYLPRTPVVSTPPARVSILIAMHSHVPNSSRRLRRPSPTRTSQSLCPRMCFGLCFLYIKRCA